LWYRRKKEELQVEGMEWEKVRKLVQAVSGALPPPPLQVSLERSQEPHFHQKGLNLVPSGVG
jgi:hypothetical protein